MFFFLLTLLPYPLSTNTTIKYNFNKRYFVIHEENINNRRKWNNKTFLFVMKSCPIRTVKRYVDAFTFYTTRKPDNF